MMRIRQAVETALGSSDIAVESVDSGIVRLAGQATSVFDHLRAVKIARGVAGVRGVASEVENLASHRPRGVGRDDPEADPGITTATKMRLLADDAIPALEVNVDTESGVVTLFGVVPTQDAKLAAEAETSQVNGVKSVLNVLQVVPGSAENAVAANDEDVKQAVRSVLKEQPPAAGRRRRPERRRAPLRQGSRIDGPPPGRFRRAFWRRGPVGQERSPRRNQLDGGGTMNANTLERHWAQLRGRVSHVHGAG